MTSPEPLLPDAPRTDPRRAPVAALVYTFADELVAPGAARTPAHAVPTVRVAVPATALAAHLLALTLWRWHTEGAVVLRPVVRRRLGVRRPAGLVVDPVRPPVTPGRLGARLTAHLAPDLALGDLVHRVLLEEAGPDPATAVILLAAADAVDAGLLRETDAAPPVPGARAAPRSRLERVPDALPAARAGWAELLTAWRALVGAEPALARDLVDGCARPIDARTTALRTAR